MEGLNTYRTSKRLEMAETRDDKRYRSFNGPAWRDGVKLVVAPMLELLVQRAQYQPVIIWLLHFEQFQTITILDDGLTAAPVPVPRRVDLAGALLHMEPTGGLANSASGISGLPIV